MSLSVINAEIDFEQAIGLKATAVPAKRWLHVVSHLDSKYGGLSTVVPQLCSSIAATGATSVSLAAFCLPGEEVAPSAQPGLPVTYWPTSRLAWLKDGDLQMRFREAIRNVEGVHIHGLWEQSTAAAARAARSLRKPYVVSAHGMLDPWALANKRWKKKIYAALTEHATVAGAACLHALTHAEAQNYRDFGSQAPIAVIPNGVDVPEASDPETFLKAFPVLRGKRIVLFLGRIHFKKGLDILIHAWASIAKEYPGAHLVLAGPDSENTRAAIEQMIQKECVGDQVLFTEMLRNDMKWSALAAAECFVLPSYSEGLSTSVLEAMGAGLPVIVTKQCNIPEVAQYQTGWQIESTVDDLTLSLRKVLENSSETNRAIGARGLLLVQQQYDWASVARRMNEIYRWIAGGPEPQSTEILFGQSK